MHSLSPAEVPLQAGDSPPLAQTRLLYLGWAALLLVCLRAPAAPSLSPVASTIAPCPFPVERQDTGVLCLDEKEAAALGVKAGDVLPLTEKGERALGPPARMDPLRQLLLRVPIELNRATEEELMALPGIGPALAERIRAARPLRSAEDLHRIPGIGRRRAAQLGGWIEVQKGPSP
jgi:competence protein ComEA